MVSGGRIRHSPSSLKGACIIPSAAPPTAHFPFPTTFWAVTPSLWQSNRREGVPESGRQLSCAAWVSQELRVSLQMTLLRMAAPACLRPGELSTAPGVGQVRQQEGQTAFQQEMARGDAVGPEVRVSPGHHGSLLLWSPSTSLARSFWPSSWRTAPWSSP